MNLARVVGRIVATHKLDALSGRKLLLLAPVDARGVESAQRLVALDAVGAGAAELVIYVRGREASHAFLPEIVPADASIVGIVDHATREI